MKTNLLLILVFILAATINTATSGYGQNLTNKTMSKQKYICKKITFKAPAVMNNVPLAIDDSGNIYVAHGGKVFVNDKFGKQTNEICLNISDKKMLSDSIEVSSNGEMIFIQKKDKPYNKYLVFNKNGILINNLNDNAVFRISGNDMYRAERYSFGKTFEIIEMYVLDSKLNRIVDYSKYYLPKINLNQKPIGYFDNDMNLYYMWYTPEVTKIDPSGVILWKKKITFDADNWRLIGVDADSNLYALVNRKRHNGIVKLDKNLEVIAYIPIDDMLKNTDVADSAEEDGSEVYNFIVISNGDIYIKNAYISDKKKQEYVIFKFEQQRSAQ